MAEQGYIQLTRDCNQNCRFCSNPANDNRLSIEQATAIIDRFIEDGCSGIVFTGGEPTLCSFLPDLVSYCAQKDFPNRIITNGQRICDREYFRTLYDAGLRNVNISLYSVRNDVQAFLSGNADSLNNITGALRTLGEFKDVQTVVNMVINKHNSGHLSENVKWVIEHASFVRHFVWNNLDPRNKKCEENPDTVPRLNDFQLELFKAVEYVLKSGRTCRIERVPLCYMTGFEHLSTETRKIVKKERTSTYFLDEKALFSQDSYQYDKADCCRVCFIEQICAGLFEMDVFYSSEELYACFINSGDIIERILGNEKTGGAAKSLYS